MVPQQWNQHGSKGTLLIWRWTLQSFKATLSLSVCRQVSLIRYSNLLETKASQWGFRCSTDRFHLVTASNHDAVFKEVCIHTSKQVCKWCLKTSFKVGFAKFFLEKVLDLHRAVKRNKHTCSLTWLTSQSTAILNLCLKHRWKHRR